MSDYEAYYPQPPKEQTEAIQLEQSRTIASLPVIQEVLDWFDEQILEFRNPLLIENVNEASDSQTIKDQVLTAQKDAKRYKTKRDEFAARFADHIHRSADVA